jgi:Clr5 domain
MDQDSGISASSAEISVVPQPAMRKSSELSPTRWEGCRGQVFQLYIAEKKTLNEVMAIIKDEHGLNAS